MAKRKGCNVCLGLSHRSALQGRQWGVVGKDEDAPQMHTLMRAGTGSLSSPAQGPLIVKRVICAGQAKTTDAHYIWPQQNKILVCYKECSFHINIFESRDETISATVSSILNHSVTLCSFISHSEILLLELSKLTEA